MARSELTKARDALYHRIQRLETKGYIFPPNIYPQTAEEMKELTSTRLKELSLGQVEKPYYIEGGVSYTSKSYLVEKEEPTNYYYDSTTETYDEPTDYYDADTHDTTDYYDSHFEENTGYTIDQEEWYEDFLKSEESESVSQQEQEITDYTQLPKEQQEYMLRLEERFDYLGYIPNYFLDNWEFKSLPEDIQAYYKQFAPENLDENYLRSETSFYGEPTNIFDETAEDIVINNFLSQFEHKPHAENAFEDVRNAISQYGKKAVANAIESSYENGMSVQGGWSYETGEAIIMSYMEEVFSNLPEDFDSDYDDAIANDDIFEEYD